MNYNDLFGLLLKVEIYSAVAIFFILFFITAPYGKHLRKQWGPTIKSSLAWVLMEMPAIVVLSVIFIVNLEKQSLISWVFLLIWLSHYGYRTFLYPFKTNNPNKAFPIMIILFGFIFNLMNGYINGYYLFEMNVVENSNWLFSPKFIFGFLLFILGFVLNKKSEAILKSIKRNDYNDYQIPRGGLFKYVSNPHYLGELLEWAGWAILCWSPAGLAFFIFSFANLFPRAIANHKWYKEHFINYPSTRKAIIPYII